MRIGLAQINARANAEVAAGKGHDIVQFNWPPPAFEQSVVSMNDVYQELEKRLGKPVDLCIKSTYNPKTKNYYALSPSFTRTATTRPLICAERIAVSGACNEPTALAPVGTCWLATWAVARP